MSDTVAVRAGDELAWDTLEAHLRKNLDLPPDPMAVRQFDGGRANLTYLLTFGDLALVLRRPPFGTLPPGAHDMAREHKVLSKLWRVYPRAPRSLLFCDDEAVVGAPFFVMEHRTGAVIRDSVPPAMAHHADVGRRAFLALVDAVADLHRVDPEDAGLGDLGKPEGFMTRQLEGWLRRWERLALPELDADMRALHDELAARLPAPIRTSLVHLDLKLDNCQFSPDDPDHVTSVFDWDMCTLGDPLADLGLLLCSSYSADGQPNPMTTSVGLPPRTETVARYAGAMGIDVDQLDWYEAFACWRTGVVIRQLAARHLRGEAHDDRLAGMDAGIPNVIERARGLLSA